MAQTIMLVMRAKARNTCGVERAGLQGEGSVRWLGGWPAAGRAQAAQAPRSGQPQELSGGRSNGLWRKTRSADKTAAAAAAHLVGSGAPPSLDDLQHGVRVGLRWVELGGVEAAALQSGGRAGLLPGCLRARSERARANTRAPSAAPRPLTALRLTSTARMPNSRTCGWVGGWPGGPGGRVGGWVGGRAGGRQAAAGADETLRVWRGVGPRRRCWLGGLPRRACDEPRWPLTWMVAPAAYQKGPDTPYCQATLEL